MSSSVVKSAAWIRMSKPASRAIAWITCPTCGASLLAYTESVICGLGCPAPASSAFALATSRFGTGYSFT